MATMDAIKKTFSWVQKHKKRYLKRIEDELIYAGIACTERTMNEPYIFPYYKIVMCRDRDILDIKNI